MTYWLGLGANLGDPVATIGRALRALSAAGVRIEAASRLYRTAPRDVTDQPAFVNAAVRVACDRAPRELLALVKRVETDLGRVPGPRFGPRMLDLDILLWDGGVWADGALEIPHPRLAERRFALAPLLDLDPDLVLPDGRAVAALEATLRDDPDQAIEPIAGPPPFAPPPVA